MQFTTKRRVALGMTTGGFLMAGLGMATAHADTTATGNTSHSPGIGSGNLIQLPVNAPINVCGNQLDVIGILDSATGNSCTNGSGSGHGGGTTATGTAKNSPGIGSGNLIQIPVNAPVNICGNQVDVIGVKNTDHGNSCANGGGSTTATGHSTGSPGIGSGNLIQVPVNAPVNVCGNQVDVIGILNSVTGNSCANSGPSTQPTPPPSPTPPPCGCTPPPPPPPPTTPCPPSGTSTSTTTPPASGTPSSTTTQSTGTPSTSTSSTGGTHHGGSNGNGPNHGVTGTPGNGGVLAHTGAGAAALAAAPLGAGLIGGGVLLRRKFPTRGSH
ncbi:MAG: chaplin [Actinocrinis sp.]